jgi:hypothetical protein
MSKPALLLTGLALTTALLMSSCTLPISVPAGDKEVTTVSIQATASATSAHKTETTSLLLPELPPFSTTGWQTDFTRRTIP